MVSLTRRSGFMVGVSSNKSNGVESYDGISPFGNAFTY